MDTFSGAEVCMSECWSPELCQLVAGNSEELSSEGRLGPDRGKYEEGGGSMLLGTCVPGSV